MTVYVAPIGYDSTRVTRPILSEGVETNDRVVLLRPSAEQDDNRAAEAITDVEQILTQIQPSVDVEVVTVPHTDFADATLTCSALLTEVDDRLVVNFGGGPRDIYLALATAVLAHPTTIDQILRFSDLDGSVETLTLPRLTGSLPDSTIETLRVIEAADGGLGIPEIAAELSKAKSTISRHVQRLETYGAVQSELHGKIKYVEITFTGRLRLRTVAAETD